MTAPLALLELDAMPPCRREFRTRAPWVVLGLLGLVALILAGVGGYAGTVPEKRVASLAAWWGAFWLGVIWLWLVVINRRTLAPDAWLMRADDEGLYVKWRSYQNLHWGRAGRQVVFVPYRCIASARHHHRCWLTPAEVQDTRQETLDYLELQLREVGDAAPLAAALAEDRAGNIDGRRAHSSVYHHHPVSLEPGTLLRIEWRARPRIGQVIELLREAGVAIGEAADSDLDLREAPTPEALAELARRGDFMGLVRVLRRCEDLDLAEAKARAESLIREAAEKADAKRP